MMEILCLTFTFVYLILLLSFVLAWNRIPVYQETATPPSVLISVIIAVRNEEKNIGNLLQDLMLQTYPSALFEILVMDDHSDDNTAGVVKSFIEKASFALSFHPAEGRIFKKKAIEQGISLSKGTLIVTTDGDCRLGKEWLSSIAGFYSKTGAKFISGPVAFTKSDKLFKEIQAIEFASLIGTGAASLQLGIPNMCNGANVAYEKAVFKEVNGFEGNEDIPSGDDEFLMHKVFGKYPDKVLFLKASQGIVYTEAKETLSDFFEQRKRWASKWGRYSYLTIKLLALFVFIYNLSFLLAAGLTLTGNFPVMVMLIMLGLKAGMEFMFLAQVLRFSEHKLDPLLFLLMQFLYPFYIVLTAVLSLFGGYTWKDRKIPS